MRAADIIRNIWTRGGVKIHAGRMAVLLLAVDSAVKSTFVTLSRLGRALDAPTTAKHRIKRIDRLLANRRVQREIPFLQRAMTRRLLRRERHPVVLLDWSQLSGRWWILCAAIPYLGRALPIFSEVHPKSSVGNRRIQDEFLDRLKAVLPEQAKPIIVADAGFRTPFFRACLKRRFDFVIRLRNRQGYLWWYRRGRIKFSEAFAKANEAAQCLGKWVPYGTQRGSSDHRIILGPKPSCSARTDYQGIRAAEPWLLATSLSSSTPTQIVSIYALRMQIEETFRDAKSPRFGFTLDYCLSDSAERLNVLVAITAFALIAVVLVGAAAERVGLHRGLQANTTRSRRVLSVTSVGIQLLRDSHLPLTMLAVLSAVTIASDVLRPLRHRRQLQLRLKFPKQEFRRDDR